MRSWISPFVNFNVSEKSLGTFYTLLSGLFFGLLGYFGMTLVSSGMSIYSMLFWRFALSALFLVLFIIIQQVRLTNRNALLQIFFYGIVFYSTCTMFYFFACQYIGTGLAMVIFYSYPIIVMAIDKIYYKNRVRFSNYLAVMVLFLGLILLVKNSIHLEFNIYGVFASLVSAALYAIYIMLSKKTQVDPIPATLMLSLGCLPTCFLAAVLTHSFTIPDSGLVWFNTIGIGILCTALPILFLLQGLTKISAIQASIFSVLEPVFVLVFGIILLKEQINLEQILGVFVLLSGAMIAMLT